MSSGKYIRTPKSREKSRIAHLGKKQTSESNQKRRATLTNDLTGKSYGEWKVIEQQGYDKWGNALWLCKCSCGITRIVSANSLRTGHGTSCGHKRNVSNSEKIFLDGLEKVWRIEIERQKEFPTEKGMRRFDGHVRGTQLLIECDGEYYHNTPEECENDIFKEKVANSWGYAVIHFKINNVKDAKQLLKKVEEMPC